MEVKTKITIKLDDKKKGREIELDLAEAKELYGKLEEIVGPKTNVYPYYLWYPVDTIKPLIWNDMTTSGDGMGVVTVTSNTPHRFREYLCDITNDKN